LGVGVTEAGLASKETPVMRDLFELLHMFCMLQQEEDGRWKNSSSLSSSLSKKKKICVLDMDNVPNNGDVLHRYMHELAADVDVDHVDDGNPARMMQDFLQHHVCFLNTMVDRITSQREGCAGMVPRCEPTPAKALVVCDPDQDLPEGFAEQPGVVVRHTAQQLRTDIALKLRIANGTHTAIAQILALLKFMQTDVLSWTSATTASTTASTTTNKEKDCSVLMDYLDALVEGQILPGCRMTNHNKGIQEEASAVWQDWRRRLVHPHFGLSSFFITQNGTAKGGIRWGPTVVDLIQQNLPLQVSFAFAYAALLRWLTPMPGDPGSTIIRKSENDDENKNGNDNGVYTGWLEQEGADDDNNDSKTSIIKSVEGAVEYADGLRYHLEQGWYEFKCPLERVTTMLQQCVGKQPASCVPAIRAYLLAPEGGKLGAVATEIDDLARAIAVLYARMLAGDGLLDLLRELKDSKYGIGFTSLCSDLAENEPDGSTRPLHYRSQSLPGTSGLMTLPLDATSIAFVVTAEVQSVVAVDLHTHLLPPTHGALCLWGIDELLTYVSNKYQMRKLT
jgi:hypothetical protein